MRVFCLFASNFGRVTKMPTPWMSVFISLDQLPSWAAKRWRALKLMKMKQGGKKDVNRDRSSRPSPALNSMIVTIFLKTEICMGLLL